MTTIRTGNNRRRANTKHAAMVQRNRYVVLDFETCELWLKRAEGILSSNASMICSDVRSSGLLPLMVPSGKTIDSIAQTIDAFVSHTQSIPPMSMFADYGPEILVNRGDNANPTSVAYATEQLLAMIEKEPMLRFVGQPELRKTGASPFDSDFDDLPEHRTKD